MPRNSGSLSATEAELQRLQKQELELLEDQKRIAELPKLLERERKERDSTLPPFLDAEERARARRHEEELATRGAVRNAQKAQNRSLLLLIMLVFATAALIAWGMRLMNG
jgi:hypothetical protein